MPGRGVCVRSGASIVSIAQAERMSASWKKVSPARPSMSVSRNGPSASKACLAYRRATPTVRSGLVDSDPFEQILRVIGILQEDLKHHGACGQIKTVEQAA